MFNICGVDPGTNYLGVSFIGIDEETLEIVNIETLAIDISNKKPYNPLNNRIQYSLLSLHNRIVTLFMQKEPVAMSIENPFSYGKSPGSVIPLGKALGVLENAFIDRDHTRYIKRISPSEVKKSVGVSGNSGDKGDIYRALLKMDIVTKHVNLGDLTDDAHDSIAIALDLYKSIKENPYILL